MLKINYFRNASLLLLFSFFSFSITVSAHEGHEHNHDTVITIEKKTYIHFQAVLLGYQYIYSYMVKSAANKKIWLAHTIKGKDFSDFEAALLRLGKEFF